MIIPAYNEQKNIARVVAGVRDLGFPVLVVDDGSGDDTAQAAARSGAEVVSSAANQGKGAALRRGIRWLLETSRYPAAVFMDSDGQHDPADLKNFLAALEEPASGLVIGDRMGSPGGMPLLRRWTNRLMSGVLSCFAGQRVPDTQCGYRAARREVLSRMMLETDRFEIESEMALEAARAGVKIVSVPVRSVYENGKSHIHPGRDTARFFKFLFCYLLKHQSKKKRTSS